MSQIWLLVALALALAATLFPRNDAEISNVAFDLRSDTWEIWLFFALCMGVLIALYRLRFLRWVDQKAVPRGYAPDATRHFTTRMHFELAAMVYCGTGLAIMALLFLFPRETVVLACAADSVFQTQICIREGDVISFTWLPLEENTQPRSLPALALGFAAALAFLTLPRIEAFLRDALQKAALIPERARTLESTLLDNFQRFRPDPATVIRFVDDFNARSQGPRLYAEDFDPETHDELYLEIYPRLEFILAQIAALGHNERIALGYGRFADDLTAMDTEMKRLRAGIRESAGAIRRLFGKENAALIAEAHRKKGYDLPRGAPYSVTVLDDILRDIQATNEPDEDDDADAAQQKREIVALTNFVSESLRSLRANCDVIHRDLIRMVVLMALHCSQGPTRTLRYFGLSGRMDRMELELLPLMLLGTLGLSIVTVLGVHQAGGVDTSQIETFAHAFAMPAAALFGGYLIATQSRRGLGTKDGADGHGIAQMSAAFLGGLMTTALVIFWLPSDTIRGPDAAISPALYFAPVAAVYGCFAAKVFFRQAAGVALVRRRDWWRWPAYAAAMLFVSRLISAMADTEGKDMTLAISRADIPGSGVSHLELTLLLAVIAAIGALIYIGMVRILVANLERRHCMDVEESGDAPDTVVHAMPRPARAVPDSVAAE